MTPKQTQYARHRAAGLGQAQAAKLAGYSPKSAKVSASRMERNPAIRAAIDEGRKAPVPEPEFQDSEAYLLAVVQGLAVPDPVRVGAARALLPFERARQRAPKKSAPPRQLNQNTERAAEQYLLDQWAEKAAEVRARLKRA